MVGSIRGVAAVVVAVTLGGLQVAEAQSKLVNPVYGEAQIQITKPATKVVGGDVDHERLYRRVFAKIGSRPFFIGLVGEAPPVVELPGFEIE